MSGTPTAVLFDVDGTLMDSNYGYTSSADEGPADLLAALPESILCNRR
jgi:phosphoglycolate phosphatase-like HAD superfamily hydrolase